MSTQQVELSPESASAPPPSGEAEAVPSSSSSPSPAGPAVSDGAFPLEARVVLHGLVNAADLNGQVGVVRSGLVNGRHAVVVATSRRTVNVRPANLRYEERPLESLSVRELKLVLKEARAKGGSSVAAFVEADVVGLDRAGLQALVLDAVGSPSEIPELLAKAKAPTESDVSIGGTTQTATPTTTTTADTARQAAEQLQNMSPDQIRQQAQMMRAMDPNVLRRMNPQLANMTDDQLRLAADQMEMMANNPEMMRAAAEHMKAMNTDHHPSAGSGGTPDMMAQMEGGGDPTKLLASMDKDQLRQALHTIRDNPEMLKKFSDMTGMSEDKVKQGVELFAEMDDSRMDAAIGVMQKVQKAKDLWVRANAKTGGHLKTILIGIGLALMGLVVWWCWSFFLRRGGSRPVTMATDIPNIAVKIESAPDDEDDLASEF